jgi:hypothetical protein
VKMPRHNHLMQRSMKPASGLAALLLAGVLLFTVAQVRPPRISEDEIKRYFSGENERQRNARVLADSESPSETEVLYTFRSPFGETIEAQAKTQASLSNVRKFPRQS